MDFDNCGQRRKDKIISVAENNRKFILKNPQSKLVNQVKVDGCLITEGKRCDYLFEVDKPIQQVFYVELKGKDIEKACEQLKITLNACKKRHQNTLKECHVVASRIPKLGTGSQAFKKKFRNETKITLKLHTQQANLSI